MLSNQTTVSDFHILKALKKIDVYLNEMTVENLAAKYCVDKARMRALIQTSINSKNWI